MVLCYRREKLFCKVESAWLTVLGLVMLTGCSSNIVDQRSLKCQRGRGVGGGLSVCLCVHLHHLSFLLLFCFFVVVLTIYVITLHYTEIITYGQNKK